MTRNEFIKRLRAGLGGMPAEDIAEIVSDYEAHFDAAAADGRPEAEVAEALGNPGRLAAGDHARLRSTSSRSKISMTSPGRMSS